MSLSFLRAAARASTSSTLKRHARATLSTATVRRQEIVPPHPPPVNDLPTSQNTPPEDDGGPPTAAWPKVIENPIKASERHGSSPFDLIQYHVHFRCTPNNTLVNVTDETGATVRGGAFSGGLCGFKGVNRAGYEAAYQCAVRAFKRVEQLVEQMPGLRVEMLFKGFGPGRDAVYRALMTSEGETIRPRVSRLTDNTPIKVGGTRARKTRRL